MYIAVLDQGIKTSETFVAHASRPRRSRGAGAGNFEGDLELRGSCNPGATLNDFSRLTLNALRDLSLVF
jgi:hypothetical protein